MKARRSLSRNQRAELFLEHGGICHICGARIHAERGEAWEVEHVLALEISGRDDWDNLRPAHVACHRVKTAEDVAAIAKSNRIRARHLGIRKPSRMAGAKTSPYRKKLDGTVICRATGEPITKGR